MLCFKVTVGAFHRTKEQSIEYDRTKFSARRMTITDPDMVHDSMHINNEKIDPHPTDYNPWTTSNRMERKSSWLLVIWACARATIRRMKKEIKPHAPSRP